MVWRLKDNANAVMVNLSNGRRLRHLKASAFIPRPCPARKWAQPLNYAPFPIIVLTLSIGGTPARPPSMPLLGASTPGRGDPERTCVAPVTRRDLVTLRRDPVTWRDPGVRLLFACRVTSEATAAHAATVCCARSLRRAIPVWSDPWSPALAAAGRW